MSSINPDGTQRKSFDLGSRMKNLVYSIIFDLLLLSVSVSNDWSNDGLDNSSICSVYLIKKSYRWFVVEAQ